MIVAMACQLKGSKMNAYTERVDSPELDELNTANPVARHVGINPPIVQEFRTEGVLSSYLALIAASEAPVIDTSCAAMLIS